MNGGAGTNYGTLMVRLKNWEEREFYSVANVVNQITLWAMETMPEADVTAFQMPQIPGYGSGSAIELNLQNSSSDDDATFINYSNEFTRKLNERPEVAIAMASYSDNFPKYTLTVDVAACKSKGISPKTVIETIGTNLAGSYIGTFTKYGKVYYVIVEAGNEYRMEPSTLNSIYVQAGDEMTPASELVTLTPTLGASQERRFNLFTSYNLNVIAALQQHIVQEVAYRVGSQSLNGLLIVCMEIQSMILEGSNDVHPVAVLLGVNINLLQHILLHLLQFVSINSLLHVGDTLVQQTNGNLLLVGIHRAVSLQLHDGILATQVEAAIGTY
jgi:multidrug efflux pump subunit AcrB